MMFRNLQPDELKRISDQLDTYNYLMAPHFTNEIPNYSSSIINNRENKANKQRIAETIKKYVIKIQYR